MRNYAAMVFGYLSEAWMHAMDAALGGDEALALRTRGARLVVQHTVTGSGEERSIYAIRLEDGHNSVVSGAATDVDVSFTSDRATASAIASGHESAQSAFLAGRLRIGGDPQVLIANQHLLTGIGDVFADVRARTDFGNANGTA